MQSISTPHIFRNPLFNFMGVTYVKCFIEIATVSLLFCGKMET